MTDDTVVLVVHDFKRFLAVADYEDNVSAFIVAAAQGMVFIFTLVVSQVLARGSRSTMGDLLQSRVTKAAFALLGSPPSFPSPPRQRRARSG